MFSLGNTTEREAMMILELRRIYSPSHVIIAAACLVFVLLLCLVGHGNQPLDVQFVVWLTFISLVGGPLLCRIWAVLKGFQN